MLVEIDEDILQRLIKFKELRKENSTNVLANEAIRAGMNNWSAKIIADMGGKFPGATEELRRMREKNRGGL